MNILGSTAHCRKEEVEAGGLNLGEIIVLFYLRI